MSWLPDSGWLRALDLRASTFAAVALGCWAVFGLAEFGLLYLGVLPTWVRAVFVIVALVASLLWLGRLWDLTFARFTGWRQRRAILAQLDALSKDEKVLLSRALRENTRCVTIFSFHPAAMSLKAKGLVESNLFVGEDAPHIIPSHVWRKIDKKRSEFIKYSDCRLSDE